MNKVRQISRKVRTIVFLIAVVSSHYTFSQGTTCAGATSVTVGGTCPSGTINDATINGNSTVCGGTVIREGWYKFAATSSSITIEADAGNRDVAIELLSTCAGAAVACDNTTSGGGADVETLNVTGLTVGTTYYVRVVNVGTGNMTLNSLCITVTPAGGAGCTSNSSLYPTATFTPNCTGSSQNITTAGYATEYSMVYVTSGQTYTFTSSVGTDYLTLANGAGGAPVYAAGTTPVVWTSTVTGAIRVYDNINSSCGTNTSFRTRSVACGTPPPPLTNDDPTGATTLTIGASCTYTTYSNAGAAATTCGTIPAPGCASYSGGDVWFAVTTPTGGAIEIDTQTGGITDGGMAVYSGAACGTMTLLACDDDGSSNGLMPTISIFGQTPGTVLYIRFWEYGGDNNGSFGICVTVPPPSGPCGNPTNNDYCSNPAQLTPGVGTFSSTTSSTFSSDIPSNLGSIFCGSIENNSWYRFTAAATSQTFNFSGVSGCTSGIQAQVYAVAANTLGCCTSFTAKSNCFNPGFASAGVVTATSLAIGTQYVLMVDGYGGDVCDFVVSGWTATGILPMELISFTGKNDGNRNILTWLTASETNNDHFTLERSKDGINFDVVTIVKGAGNSSTTLTYYAYDYEMDDELTYYRLKQTDNNGNFKYSHLITVDLSEFKNQLSNVHPNPTENNINFDVYSKNTDNIKIVVTSYAGNIIIERMQNIEKGNNTLNLELTDWRSGIYILKVVFEKTGETFIHKIIKH